MADQQVLASQQWVNKKYGHVAAYVPAPENGITGWPTMYALTMGLQVELGITALSDSFGPTTLADLTAQFPVISSATREVNENVSALIQCAMWCHGYWGGVTIGTWDDQTEQAVSQFNSDVGVGNGTSFTPKVVKALFSTDPYTQQGSGIAAEVRAVQQWLNGHYLNRRDFYVIPCDGNFSREVQIGMVYAIQYELGLADGVANGSIGPTTTADLRAAGTFGPGHVDSANNLVRLFQGCLRLNGYSASFSGNFDSTTSSLTSSFQSFSQLPVTGAADFSTWAGLLLSTGDPSRATSGADMSTILTTTTAADLYNSGYRRVGRYMSVAGKGFAPGETELIFAAGLQIMPIFQQFNNAPQYFSYDIGHAQGLAAVLRARQLGFAEDTVLWFPVDYDFEDDEVTALVIPYFQGVKDALSVPFVKYKIGVYGARNICSRVMAGGFSSTAWIAGLSTGWSGNLGFVLPQNWAYQQIAGVTEPDGLGIDKDVVAPSAPVLRAADVSATPLPVVDGQLNFDGYFWWIIQLEQQAEIASSGYSDVIPSEVYTYWMTQQKVQYQTAEFKGYAGIVGDVEDVSVAYAQFVNSAPSAYDSTYDWAHWAIVYRGHTRWGLPRNSNSANITDTGSWAFDLATVWVSYVKELDGSSVYDYVYANVANCPEFGVTDLMADVDGYNVAYETLVSGNPFVSDAIRQQQLNNLADPRWRYQQWYSHRFGGDPATLSAVVSNVFDGTNIQTSAPYAARFAGTRLPSASELVELTQAFVNKFLPFTTEVDPPNVSN